MEYENYQYYSNFIGLFLIVAILLFGIQIALSLFVNNYHKIKYDKGNILSWFPVTRIYVLSKCLINETTAFIILGVNIFLGMIEIEEPSIRSFLNLGLNLLKLGLYVYGIREYNNLKRMKMDSALIEVRAIEEVKNNPTPVGQMISPAKSHYCTNCGFELADDNNFCMNCGTPIAK